MQLAGILNAATKLLPVISAGIGVAGQIKNLITSGSGASTNAQSGSSSNQTMGTTSSSQTSTGQTQQTTSQYGGSTGTSETIGDVGSLGSILTKALGTATGNNSGLAANFNAGQAQTANNLQTGSWTLANLMNQLNAAWQNKKLTEAATTANAFNAAEAQKTETGKKKCQIRAIKEQLKT